MAFLQIFSFTAAILLYGIIFATAATAAQYSKSNTTRTLCAMVAFVMFAALPAIMFGVVFPYAETYIHLRSPS